MSEAYNNYLNEHKTGVKEAYAFLNEKLPDIIAGCEDAEWRIGYAHDESKYSDEEYGAYDQYFYGNNRSHAVVSNFRYAWLHHIHNNPHHWQYWVLINDEPEEGTMALPMPYDFIVEMICDWWSFSFRTGNLYEIFSWYEAHKERMILHPDTRKQVERILARIRTSLDKEKEK